VLMERFAPCVVGKTTYKNRLRAAKQDAELFTTSDEAFLLLVLENAYDRWVDIFQRKLKEGMQKGGGREWRWESDVNTKYTEGGIRFQQTPMAGDRSAIKTKDGARKV
jgi:hypothetical protein